MGVHLLSSIKDEGPFLLEWIAHHKVVGFDRIMIAYNDCSDGSDSLINMLAGHGEIDAFENILEEGDLPQRTAYRKLKDHEFVESADWLAVFDADEFLNVHIGEGQVQDLLEHAGDVDMVQLNWLTFGSGEQEFWSEELVTQKFTNAALGNVICNAGPKAITRTPRNFRSIFNHHAGPLKDKRPVRTMDGNGAIFEYPSDMRPNEERSPRHFKPHQIGHEIAQINHYATKTLDSFCLRAERGRGFQDGLKRHTMDYFMDIAVEADTTEESIAKYSGRLQDELSRLLALDGVQPLVDQINADYNARTKRIQRDIETLQFEDKYL